MNDHDRDLILALVADDLSDEDAEIARARIASDPHLAAELADQVAAQASLAALPDVTMTSSERRQLRSALIAALNLDEVPAAQPVAHRRRTMSWWQPALGLAAVVVVVGAAIVIPATSTNDEGDTAAFNTLPPAESEITSGGADAPDEALDDGEGGSAMADTAEVLTFDETDGSDLLDVTEGETDPATIADALEQSETAPMARSNVNVLTVEQCLEKLDRELPQGNKILLGVEARQTGTVVFLGIDPGTGVDAVATVAIPECVLVDLDE